MSLLLPPQITRASDSADPTKLPKRADTYSTSSVRHFATFNQLTGAD